MYGPAYANRRADDVVDVSVLSQGVPACRDGNVNRLCAFFYSVSSIRLLLVFPPVLLRYVVRCSSGPRFQEQAVKSLPFLMFVVCRLVRPRVINQFAGAILWCPARPSLSDAG